MKSRASSYSWGAGSGQLSTYRVLTLLYDENGNITRNITYSTSLMDNLTYNYTSGTNRLTHVDDGVSSGTHADDLDDQGTNNYLYDDAGNLISDAQSTATMSWTAYGKVREVERTDIDQKTRFGYDAGQNRVAKAVIDVSATDTLYTYYVRDAQGNVMAVYERQEDTISWQEQHLYGSARLGILQPRVRWYPGQSQTNAPYFTDSTTLFEGWKYYEITNHLGNVMATINDRKAQFDTDSDDVADYYEAADQLQKCPECLIFVKKVNESTPLSQF